MNPKSGRERPSLTVVESVQDLAPYLTGLENLAAEAIEPNPFYEPWILEPAVRLLPQGAPRFVLVFAPPANTGDPPLLTGFFPVELVSQFGNFPIRTLRSWRYKFCYLCLPLLRKAYERDALTAFISWALTRPWGARVLALEDHSGDGPFHKLLVDILPDVARVFRVDSRRSRPLLERAQSAQAYLDAAISRRGRQNLERLERRLAETGPLAYVELGPGDPVDDWIEAFLSLEAAGWKGRRGVALAWSPQDTAFFRDTLRAAHQRGKLSILGIRLDGNFIALRCSFVTGHAAFGFVLTYDESFAARSPGLLLEVESIRRLHRDHPDVLWVDSCADRRNPMFDRIWKDKRIIETVVVSTGSLAGDLSIVCLPFLRWLRDGVRRASARIAPRRTPKP